MEPNLYAKSTGDTSHLTTSEKSVEDGIRILLAGYMETGWARLGLQAKLNKLFEETLQAERQKREEVVEAERERIKPFVKRVRLDVDVIICDCGEKYKDSDLDLSVGELEKTLTQPNNPK